MNSEADPDPRRSRLTRRVRNATLVAGALLVMLCVGADELDGISWISRWVSPGRVRIVFWRWRAEVTILTSDARYPLGEWGVRRGETLDPYQGDWSWRRQRYVVRGCADLRPVAFGLFLPGVVMILADGLHSVNQAEAKNKRRMRGLCVVCEYPRAGLAPLATCPECGLVPTKPADFAYREE